MLSILGDVLRNSLGQRTRRTRSVSSDEKARDESPHPRDMRYGTFSTVSGNSGGPVLGQPAQVAALVITSNVAGILYEMRSFLSQPASRFSFQPDPLLDRSQINGSDFPPPRPPPSFLPSPPPLPSNNNTSQTPFPLSSPLSLLPVWKRGDSILFRLPDVPFPSSPDAETGSANGSANELRWVFRPTFVLFNLTYNTLDVSVVLPGQDSLLLTDVQTFQLLQSSPYASLASSSFTPEKLQNLSAFLSDLPIGGYLQRGSSVLHNGSSELFPSQNEAAQPEKDEPSTPRNESETSELVQTVQLIANSGGNQYEGDFAVPLAFAALFLPVYKAYAFLSRKVIETLSSAVPQGLSQGGEYPNLDQRGQTSTVVQTRLNRLGQESTSTPTPIYDILFYVKHMLEATNDSSQFIETFTNVSLLLKAAEEKDISSQLEGLKAIVLGKGIETSGDWVTKRVKGTRTDREAKIEVDDTDHTGCSFRIQMLELLNMRGEDRDEIANLDAWRSVKTVD